MSRERRGAFLVLGVAVAFYLFFQTTKQIPALAAVNASANDPYDAIGSFGIQAAGFFALLSVVRCFWWGRGARESSAADRFLIVRTEMASVLAVGVTLAGDLVAMLRHPALWTGTSAGWEYAVLLCVVAALDVSIGLYLARAPRTVPGRQTARAWLWASCSAAVFVAVLALYPEPPWAGVPGALFTILVGIVLLFAPMRFLLLALLPESAAPSGEAASRGRSARRWLPWAAVAVVGAAAGLALLSAEMLKESGGTVPPVAQLLRVAVIYLGIEVTGLFVGFAVLRGSIGLTVGMSRGEHLERN